MRTPAPPSTVQTADGPRGLDELIAADPDLPPRRGRHVAVRRAPAVPAQDHRGGRAALPAGPPHARARARRLRGRGRGGRSPSSAPERSYRDDNHKPELVYALTRFDAMVGFRAPRRAAELLADLDTPLAADLHALLAADPTSTGVRDGVRVAPAAGDAAGRRGRREVRRGLRAPPRGRVAVPAHRPHGHAPRGGVPGRPGRGDVRPAQPGDPAAGRGAVRPRRDRARLPAGASASRSWRTRTTCCAPGLTQQARRRRRAAATTSTASRRPPIRIAPERVFTSTRIFYAPVDDFELSVTRLTDDGAHPAARAVARGSWCASRARSRSRRRTASRSC